MKFILPFLFFLSACSDILVQDENNGDPKSGSVDYCETFGWYNDGRCDKDCAKPDPDCGAIPDCETNPTQFSQKDNACEPENFQCSSGGQYYEDACGQCGCVGDAQICNPNPDVQYFGTSDAECDSIDFTCADGNYYRDDCGCGCVGQTMCELNPDVDYVAFGDDCQLADYTCEFGTGYYADECGCGCILDQQHCEYDGPGVAWFSTDPEVCSQENIRPECPRDTTYFSDECGCGCAPRPNCETDNDCPGGFCDRQLEVPACLFTECGDGSEILCDALPPMCPPGQVSSATNGCWGDCVSARTCEFVCQNDDECAALNGTLCVIPDCPPVEGVVCENFCGR